jgi:DnaJ homolog subfamily C member 28
MADIEEHIRRAIEEGQFDNLPGKGKPLRLDQNAHEDPEWRMANQILRNGGFTLPWIEKQREIEALLETARAALGRAWARRQSLLDEERCSPAEELAWRRAMTEFRKQIEAINKHILSYNLQTPLGRFQRRLLNPELEIEKIAGKK